MLSRVLMIAIKSVDTYKIKGCVVRQTCFNLMLLVKINHMIKIGVTKAGTFIIIYRIDDGERVSLKFFFRGFTPIEEKPHHCKYCGGLTVTDDNNCLEKYPNENSRCYCITKKPR